MKKLILILSLFSTGTSTAKIILTSPIVNLMDGIAISGPVIGQLLKIRADGIRIRTVTEYVVDGVGYTTAQLVTMEAEGSLTKEQLNAYLVPAKEDFTVHIAPFLDEAQETKDFMLNLIEEWSEKAERPDSLLLMWGNTAAGTEQEMFKREIVSFKAFDLFTQDLISFLETIIHSCKKARAEFKRDYLSKG